MAKSHPSILGDLFDGLSSSATISEIHLIVDDVELVLETWADGTWLATATNQPCINGRTPSYESSSVAGAVRGLLDLLAEHRGDLDR